MIAINLNHIKQLIQNNYVKYVSLEHAGNTYSPKSLEIDGEQIWVFSPIYFVLSKDETYYSVEATDYYISGDIIIPRENEGKPVIKIGASAFYSCDSITSVVIPDSVIEIGDSAFLNCSNLTKVVIPDRVYIYGHAFDGCPIEEATIPALAIQDIEKSNLKTVVITSGTSISDEAFLNCDSLTSVVIPDSVASIGEWAFTRCSNLTSVILGNSVETIGKVAFYSCSSLVSVTIPDSVKTIGVSAFNGCSNLTDVIIGSGVEEIDHMVFQNCSSLTNVYYNGTEDDWNSISIGSENDDLTNATRYYYSEFNPHREGHYWYRDENGEVATWPPHVHTEEIIPAVPATCTTTGWTEGKKCSVCGKILVEQEIVPALGHTYGDWVIDIPPTCTVKGSKHTNCAVCGDTITEEILATGHSYTSVVTPPTCTEKGYTTYTCHCGDSYVADEVEAIGHKTGEVVVENNVAPTCTKDGSYDMVTYCSICGEELSRTTHTTYATGHFESDWIIDTPATCTNVGKKHTECTVCGKTIRNEEIYQTHNYVDGKCSICYVTSEEYFEYDSIYNAIKEKDSKNMPSDIFIPSTYKGEPVDMIADGAFTNCYNTARLVIPNRIKRIGDNVFTGRYSDFSVYYIGTEAEWNNIRISSFNGGVLTTRTRYYYSETHPTVAGNYWHWVNGEPTVWCCNIQTLDATNPTCTKPGLSAGKYCVTCGEIVEGHQETSPALGHNEIFVIEIPAKCTAPGRGIHKCSVCNQFIGESIVIPATGHSYRKVVNDPTCTEKGYTAYICSNCGVVKSREDEVEALGHDEIHHEAKFATCTENGWEEYVTCTRCDYTTYKEIPATGHRYRNWIIDKEATCTDTGRKHKECIRCGDTITEEIPALEHQYEDGFCTVCGCSSEDLFSFTQYGDSYVEITAKDVTKLPHRVVIPGTWRGLPVIIGEHGFEYSPYLNELILLEGIIKILASAFFDCFMLGDDLAIPSTVEVIESNAFGQCDGIRTVTFAEATGDVVGTRIENGAFSDCHGLQELSISSSVTEVEEGAFERCYGLESISVAEGNQKYHSENNCLIETTTHTVILGCKNSDIPDDVAKISSGAFNVNTYFAPIKIPLSVTEIEPLAFRECEGLTVYVPYKQDEIPSGWADNWHDGSITVVYTNTYLVTESGEYLTDEQGNLLII